MTQREFKLLVVIAKNRSTCSRHLADRNRFLIVKKNNDEYCITITDTKTHKSAEFSVIRWASFTRCFDAIDESVNGIRERKNIAYLNHYRRRLTHLRYDRNLVRRPTKVLSRSWQRSTQAVQNRDRSTTT
jgi:hypothetical protein